MDAEAPAEVRLRGTRMPAACRTGLCQLCQLASACPSRSFKFQSEDGQEVVASNVLQWGSGAGDYDTGIQFSAGGGSSSSNGGGNSSSSTSSSAPSGSLGSSDSPAPSSPAPSPSPPSTGSSPSGLPFSPENYVTHLDQVSQQLSVSTMLSSHFGLRAPCCMASGPLGTLKRLCAAGLCCDALFGFI